MKKVLPLLLSLQLLSLLLNAQSKQVKTKWKAEPFDYNVFIENNGQFNGALPDGQKIYFEAQLGKIMAYFTRTGVVYSYTELKHAKESTAKNKDEEEKKEKPETHYLSALWKGSISNGDIGATVKQSYFYAYGAGKSGTIKANVYKQIVYKNIYPGIDAEYSFAGNKAGIKYSLIIHPGAVVDLARLEYTGADSIRKDENGNIVINSELGEITDHAPSTYYMSGAPIVSNSNLAGTTETFKVTGYYDKTQTIVIDPWTTSTSFSGINAAFDIDYDNKGDVYAYGGESISTVLQLVKFNSAGIKQWVYNASTISDVTEDCYGDICTDKSSGTVYVLQGFSAGIILKISSAGNLVTSYPGGGTVDEYWRADFDQCNHQIVIGAGGTGADYQACTIDTNLTTLTPVNFCGATEPYHDITLMTLDPYTNSAFMCTAKNVLDTLFANHLYKLPLPTLTPTTFGVHNGYGFGECTSVGFEGYQSTSFYGYATNAMNGAAASPNWVYLFNGDTLKQFDKTTGKLNAMVGVSTIPFKCGGLDVDACDDIFVANFRSIQEYNSTLSLVTTIPLNDTIYDLHLGPNNTLLACGQNFVASMVAPISKNIVATITYPTTCSACNGKASATPNCGKAPYTYLWSNGSTNQMDTGLCAGIYTVTITDAACPPNIDTAVVDISGKAGYGASIIDSAITCRKATGSLTINATGGSSPYTYTWSNGETTQKDTGLSPGSYNCTVTDNSGCKYTTSATLVTPPPAFISISPPVDSICNGASATLLASGGSTYMWSPSAGLSCTNCPNPIATPTANTWYTVVGIDSLGCVGHDSVIVAFSPPPTVTITSFPEGCSGTFLEASGASSYTWLPDSGLSCTNCFDPFATDTATITYTVVGYQHGCADSAKITIPGLVTHTINIVATKDTICSGDSTKLTAVSSVTFTYLDWYPTIGTSCPTCTVTWVKPTVTTTYEVYGYDSTGCPAYAFITIVVNGVGVYSESFGCGGPTYLFGEGSSTGIYTWAPAAGLSCTSCPDPVASPTVTTTYTVYGSGSGTCPGKDTATVVIVPSIVPTATIKISPDTICLGDSISLSSKSKGLPTHYWYASSGIITCDTCANTHISGLTSGINTVYYEGFDSLGCFFDTAVSVFVTTKISVTDSVFACLGITKLYATGSGAYIWSPATGLNVTTGANVVASPTVNTSYTVTGVGCPGTDTAIMNVAALPPLATVNISTTKDTVCPGDSTTVIATGKNINTYSWFPSAGFNCPACGTTSVQVNSNSTYTCFVTNSEGCSSSATIKLYAGNPVSSTKQYYTCPGKSVTLTASGGISYIWSTGATTTSISVTPAKTETYTVVGAIKGGCSDTVYNIVNVNPAPVPVLCCSTTITNGQSVSLTSSGGGSYAWAPSTGLSCTACPNPIASPTTTTAYFLTITSDSGCVAGDSLLITVKENCESGFDVPNVFTPNGDNNNDVLLIDASTMTSYSIEVFDRWGTKVFSSTNANEPWNGKTDNSGGEQSDGVYYYVIKATCGNTSFEKKGFVQLIR